MATLPELCEFGVLDTIDPLEPDELPWRTLYGTGDFIRWLETGLPSLYHNPLFAELSPVEQVFALFAEYAAGEDFVDDRRFKKLSCTPERYVWELKTEEVRIFGWVPSRDKFICCFGDSKDQIQLWNSYGSYIAKTVYVRNNLDLDDPKHVMGLGYPDVISNKA